MSKRDRIKDPFDTDKFFGRSDGGNGNGKNNTWKATCRFFNQPCGKKNPSFRKGQSCPHCGLKEDGSFNW